MVLIERKQVKESRIAKSGGRRTNIEFEVDETTVSSVFRYSLFGEFIDNVH